MDELTCNALRAWWHRVILRHVQQPHMNGGDGPPRIDCYCQGLRKPTTWKV